jgi:hypothetical protein
VGEQRIPTFAEAVEGRIERRLRAVRVALPGIVQSYDHETQRASVQPSIRDVFEDESGALVSENLPIVNEVPVVFPGTGPFAITWPLEPGDEVLLVFSSSGLDRWLSKGGIIDPESDQRHALDDAVAIPGLRHGKLPGGALGDGMVMAAPEVAVRANEVRIEAASTKIVGNDVQLGADNLINPLLDGVVLASGIDPFTGSTYGALGNASAIVKARKV